MPGMDGSAPLGNGRRGRGLGPCGRGGRRAGFGRGVLLTTVSADEEKQLLEQDKSWLETQLAAITQRLQKLTKTDTE